MADTLAARKKGRKGKALPPPPSAARSSSTVSERILEAVAAAGTKKGRRGLSLAALKKLLSGNGYDVAANRWRLKQAVRSLVAKGSLVQTSGSGASGSFKLGSTKAQREVETAVRGAESRKKVRRGGELLPSPPPSAISSAAARPPIGPGAASASNRRKPRKPAAAKRPKRSMVPRKTRPRSGRREPMGRRTARGPKPGRKAAARAGPRKAKRRPAKPRKAAKILEEASQLPSQEEVSASAKANQGGSDTQNSSS
ncbi:histone H1.2-like [Hemiscyllium ocellatum]|uniref:histone H1.2-like n=1 Tax=Hemiscyllium ocellatum TaxID=170820 RepID=UPI00296720FE|nr:histone H1.2-like [Hemiscyllium ocellatum]